MLSRVGKRRGTLFGVDLSKNFGMSSVLDLSGERNDVLQILTNICATAGVEIKIEPLNSCSLRAARIKRSDSDVLYMHLCIYASMHLCIYASMHLCVYASMRLSVYAFVRLCVYASVRLCICAPVHLCIYASMHL